LGFASKLRRTADNGGSHGTIHSCEAFPGVSEVIGNLWQLRLIDGEYDVFDDGSVVCLETQGHTPRHQCCACNLVISVMEAVAAVLDDLVQPRPRRSRSRGDE